MVSSYLYTLVLVFEIKTYNHRYACTQRGYCNLCSLRSEERDIEIDTGSDTTERKEWIQYIIHSRYPHNHVSIHEANCRFDMLDEILVYKFRNKCRTMSRLHLMARPPC